MEIGNKGLPGVVAGGKGAGSTPVSRTSPSPVVNVSDGGHTNQAHLTPPSQKLLAGLLVMAEKGVNYFDQVKLLFPKGELPGLDKVGKDVWTFLYQNGLCPFDVLDLRTSGRYHDFILPLLPKAGDAEPLVKSSLRELVRENMRQKMLVTLGEAQARLIDGATDPSTVLQSIVSQSADQLPGVNNEKWGEYVHSAKKEMLEEAKGKRLRSGLQELDALFRFRRGKLSIVAARTSHGKTTFGLHMVRESVRQGFRVAYLNFEDYADLPLTLAATMAGLPLDYMAKYDDQPPEHQKKALDSLEALAKRTDILMVPGVSIGEFSAQCQEFKPDVLVLDYIQEYARKHSGGTDLRLSIGNAAGQFRELVQKHRAYGILLSQFRRPESKEGGAPRRPYLSDLKESGELENGTDNALLLYWPWHDRMGKNETDLDKQRYLIEIAKARRGPVGEVEVRFEDTKGVFMNRFTMKEVG